MASIDVIDGLDPESVQRLRSAGVRTIRSLLAQASSHGERERLAADLGVTATMVLAWVNRADLMRIHGIGPDFTDLLEAAGVGSVSELARWTGAKLTARLIAANLEHADRTGRAIVRRAPAMSEVSRWIERARELPAAVTH